VYQNTPSTTSRLPNLIKAFYRYTGRFDWYIGPVYLVQETDRFTVWWTPGGTKSRPVTTWEFISTNYKQYLAIFGLVASSRWLWCLVLHAKSWGGLPGYLQGADKVFWARMQVGGSSDKSGDLLRTDETIIGEDLGCTYPCISSDRIIFWGVNKF
jgi:hypothetical protein